MEPNSESWFVWDVCKGFATYSVPVQQRFWTFKYILTRPQAGNLFKTTVDRLLKMYVCPNSGESRDLATWNPLTHPPLDFTPNVKKYFVFCFLEKKSSLLEVCHPAGLSPPDRNPGPAGTESSSHICNGTRIFCGHRSPSADNWAWQATVIKYRNARVKQPMNCRESRLLGIHSNCSSESVCGGERTRTSGNCLFIKCVFIKTHFLSPTLAEIILCVRIFSQITRDPFADEDLWLVPTREWLHRSLLCMCVDAFPHKVIFEDICCLLPSFVSIASLWLSCMEMNKNWKTIQKLS